MTLENYNPHSASTDTRSTDRVSLDRNPYGVPLKDNIPRLGEVCLEVGNTYTRVIAAPREFLFFVDQALRYPTQLAFAKEAGFIAPEDMAWDGWVRMFKQPKLSLPYFPTGLLGRVQLLGETQNYAVQIKDLRVRPDEDIPECPPISLRDYQEIAVNAALKDGRGVLDLPPRAGKTRCACEIHRSLSLPTIWIAPTDRIVTQTIGVLEGFFGKNYATHLIGTKDERKAANYRVVVCTTSTASLLSDEFYKSRNLLIVDEFHHGSAKSVKHIFQKCDHIFFRYGMTGTFFRSGEDEMAMHALLSHTIVKVDAKDLMDRGYLVPTRVVFLPVDGKRLTGVSGTYNMGHGKHGIQEHQRRNLLAAYSTVLLAQIGRKVLVLVETKKQGKILKKMISGHMRPKILGAQFDPVEFISTDVHRPTQNHIIDAFLESDEVKVLIGTSLLGEGVDLPACDALVYAKGQKAEVGLTQNAYRVCTAFGTKKNAIIVDFADRHHRKLMKHSLERLAVYHEIPIFDVTVLQSMNDFVGWLQDF